MIQIITSLLLAATTLLGLAQNANLSTESRLQALSQATQAIQYAQEQLGTETGSVQSGVGQTVSGAVGGSSSGQVSVGNVSEDVSNTVSGDTGKTTVPVKLVEFPVFCHITALAIQAGD